MEICVPENFLEGEVRSGFYVERMMKRNWACMIKVLAEFDRICEKYGLRYYADWGTLLGAVRHKGFIPWDDDIDVCMMRADFERLREVAPRELPTDWQLVSIHSDEGWLQSFDHLVTGRSVNYDTKHMEEFYGFPYIPGVDVFPLDYAPADDNEFNYVNRIIEIINFTVNKYEQELDKPEQCEAALSSIEKTCRITIDRSRNIPNQLMKLQENLSRMYTEKDSDLLALIPYYPRIKKAYFEKTVMLDFEYIKVPAPAEYEKVLEIEFGKDWRTPLIAGGDHEYPYYKKQQRIAWTALGVL